MLDRELRLVLQFQVDRACFQRREASANFSGKEEEIKNKKKNKEIEHPR